MSYRYTIFGLTVDSQLECPELIPGPADATPDFRIVQYEIPEHLNGATQRTRYGQYAPGIFQLQIDDVARYRVENGQIIRVDPAPRAAEGDVRLYLLGTCLGALIYQRGLLPLHVSAVEVDGQAFAFCGESGAGKSTLVAALHRRGFPLLTDDVGVAVPGEDGVLLYPGMPRIKLWSDALLHFGMADDPGLIRDLARTEKFHVAVKYAFQQSALPLRCIYNLESTYDGLTTIEQESGHSAIQIILENTYRPHLPHYMGLATKHLMQCGLVAKKTNVLRFLRPWDKEQLEPSLKSLQHHISDLTSSQKMMYKV